MGHLAEVSAGRHLVPGVQVVQHAGVDAGSRLNTLPAGQAPGYMTIDDIYRSNGYDTVRRLVHCTISSVMNQDLDLILI